MKLNNFNGYARLFLLAFIMVVMANAAFAYQEVIDIDGIRNAAIIIHVVELILAVFISYMALMFFKITKPLSLFLVIYVSTGFFIISSLLYIMFYVLSFKEIHPHLISVYLGSRISLILMLVSIGAMFFYLNKKIRSK